MKKYICPKCSMSYDSPGKCSMDGATLVESPSHNHSEHNHDEGDSNHDHSEHHEEHSHTDHHKMMAIDFRRRFSISAIKPVFGLIAFAIAK